MTKAKLRILLLVILFLCNAATFAKETWFNQRVTWKYGKEGLAWKTNIKEPNGQAEYQLVYQPGRGSGPVGSVSRKSFTITLSSSLDCS